MGGAELEVMPEVEERLDSCEVDGPVMFIDIYGDLAVTGEGSISNNGISRSLKSCTCGEG